MAFHIRPFGYDYVDGMTGGRFADWLERAGPEASADLAKENLKKAFGSDITKHVVRPLVTAWRGDPLVRGAYSAARPGRVAVGPMVPPAVRSTDAQRESEAPPAAAMRASFAASRLPSA